MTSQRYVADVRVTVRPMLMFDGPGLFRDRDADIEVHVSVPDAGLETSAHAIVEALRVAHQRATDAVGS